MFEAFVCLFVYGLEAPISIRFFCKKADNWMVLRQKVSRVFFFF